jgi:protein-S-isoprenylcysteine O-methyltransferase Ste14
MTLGIVGLALDITGVAFAIWARITLGNNWSNAITLKENHELVQGGPYAFVRHPIYTGMFVAMLGTALTIGTVISYLGVISSLVGILIRIRDEDALMAKEFGEAHTAYRTRTKALIPFIW